MADGPSNGAGLCGPAETSAARCFQERGPDRGRHLDRDEAIGGEEIVLTALVDDSKIAVPLGVVIGEHGVDLVALERCLIPLITYADRERRSGGLTSGRGTACA